MFRGFRAFWEKVIIFSITDAIYEFLTKFTELAIGGPRIYILGDCEFTYLITFIYWIYDTLVDFM